MYGLFLMVIVKLSTYKIMEEVFEYMQDYDNRELSEFEWKEQLMEAVRNYNSENNTNYDPHKTWKKYCEWLNQNS